MSKTLSIILTIFKVVKIVAKVIFILCIIGGIGCLISIATFPMLQALESSELYPDIEIHFPSLYLACAVGFIACVGEGIVAFFAERYFANVLSAGTPFTLEGSKECFRLGLTSIIVSAAATVISGMFVAISLLISDVTVYDTNISISLSTGLFFMFLSLIFKHGAEIQSSAVKAPKQEEQTSESESTMSAVDENV